MSDTTSDPDVWCWRCRRPAGAHGNRRRHWRVCGPATGTGPGPMTDGERARYLAAREEVK